MTYDYLVPANAVKPPPLIEGSVKKQTIIIHDITDDLLKAIQHYSRYLNQNM